VHHRRDEHVPRHESDHTKRSAQDQNVFGKKIEDGLGWDEEQCPAPLSACPVRGAVDADAVECVDLDSDLYSCGGCAADDIACVFFEAPISHRFSHNCISSYDCDAIPHVRGVECVSGSCKVHSCADGYVVAPPRDVCVPVGAP
jgi:CPL1-like protein